MKHILLIIIFVFWFVENTFALPLPVLVIGYDFLLLMIPIISSGFMMIVFYLRRYVLCIGGVLFVSSTVLYGIHSFLTKSSFFFPWEWFVYVLGMLFLLYFAQKIPFLKYWILLLWLVLVFFWVSFDIQLYKDIQHISKFHKLYGIEKYISYNIKDNFFAIYDQSWTDLVVVSNCYEWTVRTDWILLGGYIKDFDKVPFANGKCIYNTSQERQYVEIMESVIRDE